MSMRALTPRRSVLRHRLGTASAAGLMLLLAACQATSPPPSGALAPSATGPVPSGAAATPAEPSATATVPSTGTAASLPPEGSVSGVVVDMEQENPVTITSFVIRTAEGTEIRFAVGKLDVEGDGFPAVHLREHHASSQPVIVVYVTENGALTATRLLDDPY